MDFMSIAPVVQQQNITNHAGAMFRLCSCIGPTDTSIARLARILHLAHSLRKFFYQASPFNDISDFLSVPEHRLNSSVLHHHYTNGSHLSHSMQMAISYQLEERKIDISLIFNFPLNSCDGNIRPV